jgi:glutaconate CoA-transferase subunit B
VLAALHPGVTLERARASLGWEVQVAGDLSTTEPPTREELRLLRKVLDPERLYL